MRNNPKFTAQDVAELINTVEGRRLLGIMSPSFFASYYMGLQHLDHQERWLRKATQLFNKAAAIKSKEKLLVLAPRGHGKSYLSLILAVWKLATCRDSTILIVSATAGQAEKRLKAIRQYLEDPRIIEDWASNDLLPFRDESTSWLNNRLYLKREGKIIDPSIEAIGIGGSVTGAHVDFIILDDVEDSITAGSDALRRRSKEWLGGTLMPILNRGGLLLTIGTRKGSNDLYSDMLKDVTTTAIVDSAIKVWPTSYKFVTEHVGGRDIIKDIVIEGEEQAEVLWPAERPLRFLLTELATVGQVLFHREMQNQPLSGDSSVFKEQWVNHAVSRGKLYNFSQLPADLPIDYVVVGVDLALTIDSSKANSNDSDYTVLVALGVTPAGDRYLLDIARFRGATPDELYRRVELFCRGLQVQPREVRVERNSFGALHVAGLRGKSDLPFKEHQTTQRTKAEGLSRVASLLENGKYVFPSQAENDRSKIRALTDELLGYPYMKHDDTVLALSIAEHAAMNSFQHVIFVGDKEINSETLRTSASNWEAENQVVETLWSDLSKNWEGY